MVFKPWRGIRRKSVYLRRNLYRSDSVFHALDCVADPQLPKGKSIVLPAMSATFFFISAYIYLIIVGQNVPWWVYGIVILLVVYGAYSTLKSVRKKMKDADAEETEENLTTDEHG